MVFYYRRMGLIVILGMFMSAALMWVVVSWLSESRGLALSLSGAVGIIVSVGITVDSYVVYFERLRDEQRGGRTLAASVDRAFKDAWRTILAADLTSLIGASVLYFLTVGSVRGFAFFLMISTCLDMTVAYFFTRPIVAILGRRGWFGGGADPSVSRGPIPPGGGGRLRPGVAAASSSSTGGQK
jgi:preprotein translocase subunit SecD